MVIQHTHRIHSAEIPLTPGHGAGMIVMTVQHGSRNVSSYRLHLRAWEQVPDRWNREEKEARGYFNHMISPSDFHQRDNLESTKGTLPPQPILSYVEFRAAVATANAIYSTHGDWYRFIWTKSSSVAQHRCPYLPFRFLFCFLTES